MNKALLLSFALLFCTGLVTFGQSNYADSARQGYLAEQKANGKSFSSYFYPNYAKFYSLDEKKFVSKIDSAKNVFDESLKRYDEQLDPTFANSQKLEIKYFFDKLLLDYPNNHDTYLQTGKKTNLSGKLSKRLESNLKDFNRPELLSNPDFKEYVRAYFYHGVNKELDQSRYRHTDNQRLIAVWKLIPRVISKDTCREFWQTDYLFDHIDNNGIKNIEPVLNNFRATCKDQASLKKINELYSADSVGRKGHITKVYKSLEGITLDLHLFLPTSSLNESRRPVYVYFHGGSWSEGKPDWGFSNCEEYAKKGWVGVAVEYRTGGRHNTLPFESVMDARSAIRWLRKNAATYNIDTNKIVATGNSAGGHLVLATALANKWNETTDDLGFSPIPNVLMVNSAAYDLTIWNTQWITKNLKNKELVKEISPNHLSKKMLPPLLVIHGTNDGSCPFWTAVEFKNEMEKTANIFEFHELNGAGHFIWYDPKYSTQVSQWRKDFLIRLGYK